MDALLFIFCLYIYSICYFTIGDYSTDYCVLRKALFGARWVDG